MNRHFIILLLGSAIIGVLGQRFLAHLPAKERVEAVGNLTFTFNGLPPEAPVFNIDDLKPGDCYARTITAQNSGTTSVEVLVRPENIINPNNLDTILFFTIKSGSVTVYPETNLHQFLNLNSLLLSNLAANTTGIYDFTVCMPQEAGNEWQKTKLVFDLVFGRPSAPTPSVTMYPSPTSGASPTPTIPLPPECAALAGKIQRIFYSPVTGGYLHGSIYNDLIIGSSVADDIDASGGDDCVVGGEGDDYIRAEDGSDIVLGGDSNDTIDSGSSADIVYGGAGNDTINSGSGNDLVYGGIGNDTINAGTGNDTVYGEAGNDNLSGSSDNDLLNGGPDVDSGYGGSGTDTCPLVETKLSCEL